MTADQGGRFPAHRQPTAREVLLGLLLALSVAVVVWWLVGPMTIDLPDPDVAVRAPELGATVERVIGLAALVVAVMSSFLLLRSGSAIDRRWWPVLAVLLLTAAFLAYGWRVLTAEVIGANIGAGLFLLVGLPLAAIALIGVVVRAAWLLVRGRRPPAAYR